jgi:hypothetical protein
MPDRSPYSQSSLPFVLAEGKPSYGSGAGQHRCYVESSQGFPVAIIIIAKRLIFMKSVDLNRISQIGILACTLNMYGQEGSNNVEQRVIASSLE